MRFKFSPQAASIDMHRQVRNCQNWGFKYILLIFLLLDAGAKRTNFEWDGAHKLLQHGTAHCVRLMLRRLHACFALSVFVYWSTSGCFLAMHLAPWRSASSLARHSLVRKVSMHAQVHVLACATEYRQETAILQRSAARNGISDAARPDSCQRTRDDKRMSQDVKRVWWMKMNERMKSEVFQFAWMENGRNRTSCNGTQ